MSSYIHKRVEHLYTIHDLIEWQPPPVINLISNGVLRIDEKLCIFGDEGAWKSILTLHTAHCLAKGSPWLGFDTNKCNVLKIQVELPMHTDRSRAMKYARGCKAVYMSKHRPDNPTPEQLAELEKEANKYAYPSNIVYRTEEPYKMKLDTSVGYQNLEKDVSIMKEQFGNDIPLVVILDPMYQLMAGHSSDDVDTRKFLESISMMQYRFHFAVILIHHTRKTQFDQQGTALEFGSQEAAGNRNLARWSDTMLMLKMKADNPGNDILLRFTKHRNAERPMPFLEVSWDSDTLHPRITKRFTKSTEVGVDLDIRDLE